MLVMRMIRVLALPSRSNSISIPFLRKKVAARRSRPASALGLAGQVFELATRSPTTCARAPKISAAVCVHTVRLDIMVQMAAATGSASITLSTAASRLPEYAAKKVPAGQKAVSQAAAHIAKSAIRGSFSNHQIRAAGRDQLICQCPCYPWNPIAPPPRPDGSAPSRRPTRTRPSSKRRGIRHRGPKEADRCATALTPATRPPMGGPSVAGQTYRHNEIFDFISSVLRSVVAAI